MNNYFYILMSHSCLFSFFKICLVVIFPFQVKNTLMEASIDIYRCFHESIFQPTFVD